MTMIELVYISAAVREFSDEELAELLGQARSTNSRLGVSGMLLYHEGSFIQVLEGEEEAVSELYERIGRDPRHTDSRILSKREIEERAFGEWTMGFYRSSEHTRRELEGYTTFLPRGFLSDVNRNSGMARRALMAFREGNWRASVDH